MDYHRHISHHHRSTFSFWQPTNEGANSAGAELLARVKSMKYANALIWDLVMHCKLEPEYFRATCRVESVAFHSFSLQGRCAYWRIPVGENVNKSSPGVCSAPPTWCFCFTLLYPTASWTGRIKCIRVVPMRYLQFIPISDMLSKGYYTEWMSLSSWHSVDID